MRVFLGALLLCSLIYGSFSSENTNSREEKRLLFPSVLQLVRFKNEACDVDNRHGTCYTSEECSERDGHAAGACAHGYGVCCVFEKTCGETTHENCTSFTPQGFHGYGDCNLEVCPQNEHICQLRLDFDVFDITGPSTDTHEVFRTINGQVVRDGTEGISHPDATDKEKEALESVPVSTAGQCLTDTFLVTAPGGVPISPICGKNSGQHMYVDAPGYGNCNWLTFSFGQTGIGAKIASRSFDIKITQIGCDSIMRAPDGCTQYFTGAKGYMYTYNFGYRHLARQNQNMCVRREDGYCRICYTAEKKDVDLSGAHKGYGRNNLACCGYGRRGNDYLNGYDCIIVPSGETHDGEKLRRSRFCGNGGGLISHSSKDTNKKGKPKPTTVCSTAIPFSIRFLSDNFENVAEDSDNIGAKIMYWQDDECGHRDHHFHDLDHDDDDDKGHKKKKNKKNKKKKNKKKKNKKKKNKKNKHKTRLGLLDEDDDDDYDDDDTTFDDDDSFYVDDEEIYDDDEDYDDEDDDDDIFDL